MTGIVNSIKQAYTDLKTGQCLKNFKEMSFGKKALTVLKVIGIAVLAGIIGGAIGTLAGPFLSTVLGVGFAATAGIAAFAYFTSSQALGKQLKDLAEDCAKKVKEAL